MCVVSRENRRVKISKGISAAMPLVLSSFPLAFSFSNQFKAVRNNGDKYSDKSCLIAQCA